MILTEEFDVRAPRQMVWDFLLDEKRVAACMPGVEYVERTDEQSYQVRLGVKVGPIQARFGGGVTIVESNPPESLRIRADWQDRITSSKTQVFADITLEESVEGVVACRLTADVAILGILGKYGQGIAEKKASEIKEAFAACVRASLEGDIGLQPLAAGVRAEAGPSRPTLRNFDYLQPTTVEEAIGLLGEYGDEAKAMAGGQSLVLLMREGLVQPGIVIDLMGIPGLSDIHRAGTNGHVEIGALTTHRQIELSGLIQEKFPLLYEAYRNLASIQVRNLATLGGNLCHNAPGSDPPAPLIALDATVTLRGPAGERSLSVEEFGTGFYETALRGGEILTRIKVPMLPPCSGTAYHKYAVRPTDMAIVGAAVRVTLDAGGERCQDVRIALSGVAPTTIRARRAEVVLRGQPLGEQAIAEAAQAAAGEVDPISDGHASADYRRRVTPVAVQRMITVAWQRANAACQEFERRQ